MTTKKYYVLKWIAILSMLTDHIAIVLSEGISNDNYIIMRTIGRLAFPLFCYMTAESFYFTTSPKRHLLRLLLLAIISEIPYDYNCYIWQNKGTQTKTVMENNCTGSVYCSRKKSIYIGLCAGIGIDALG
ncbi:MAG: TraX family protein [Oscillospiraceae bacterium]